MFTREYVYNPEMDRTLVELTASDGAGCIIGIGSKDDCGIEGGTFFAVQVGAWGDRPAKTIRAMLYPDELDDLIAELQRAKAGCFIGEYPRPARAKWVMPEPTPFDTLVEFLKEIFGDADDDNPDDELERLLAEERKIEKAHVARTADEEAERMIAEEEEMNRRDALEDVCRANGAEAVWTASELVAWLEENTRPDQHIQVEHVDGVATLVAVG